jgi:hypothetical protein
VSDFSAAFPQTSTEKSARLTAITPLCAASIGIAGAELSDCVDAGTIRGCVCAYCASREDTLVLAGEDFVVEGDVSHLCAIHHSFAFECLAALPQCHGHVSNLSLKP